MSERFRFSAALLVPYCLKPLTFSNPYASIYPFPLFKVKHVKHSGNISLDDVIEIARIMRPRSMAKELKGTVKEILGTAKSTGCTVEGEDPQDVQQSIQDGDIEIPDK